MITKNYKAFWKKASESPEAREYILPGRTVDEFYAEGKLQAEEIQEWIKPTDVVVEYGCGVGRVLRHIKAAERIGVDVSRKFLTEAARAGIQPLETNGLTIDLPDNTADVVYSLMVLQHCPREDHPRQIAEMVRICKPGGKVYIQFPRAENGYYKQSTFVNTYKTEYFVDIVRHYPGTLIVTWDLAGYADGNKGNREYLVIITK